MEGAAGEDEPLELDPFDELGVEVLDDDELVDDDELSEDDDELPLLSLAAAPSLDVEDDFELDRLSVL